MKKATTVPKKVRRGQGGTCTGKLVISLRGPQGSGKSMVAAVLKPLLPLLPLDEFEIREELD
jgi:pantothenate kinase-related protein Tda10